MRYTNLGNNGSWMNFEKEWGVVGAEEDVNYYRLSVYLRVVVVVGIGDWR